jgi:hypothetical protein
MGADREIGDPTDFPWPHIDSILRDLKKIVGGCLPKIPIDPLYEPMSPNTGRLLLI